MNCLLLKCPRKKQENFLPISIFEEGENLARPMKKEWLDELDETGPKMHGTRVVTVQIALKLLNLSTCQFWNYVAKPNVGNWLAKYIQVLTICISICHSCLLKVRQMPTSNPII